MTIDQRAVARLICIFILKYAPVVTTASIVGFGIALQFCDCGVRILECIISFAPIWFVVIMCASIFLNFCLLHRKLVVFTFVADTVINHSRYLGYVHEDYIQPMALGFSIVGSILLVEVVIKIAKKQKCLRAIPASTLESR